MEVLQLCGLRPEYASGRHYKDPNSDSVKFRISNPTTLAGGVENIQAWTDAVGLVAYIWNESQSASKNRIVKALNLDGFGPVKSKTGTPLPAAKSSAITKADDGYSEHASSLEPVSLSERLLDVFAASKNLSVESLKACGVAQFRWKQFRDGNLTQTVFGIPVYQSPKLDIVNWTIYAATGGLLSVRGTNKNGDWQTNQEKKYSAFSGGDRVG